MRSAESRRCAIALPQEALVEFCRRWKVEEFYLFGSVLRKDFNANSDVDVMVQFSPDGKWGFEIVEMKQELEKIWLFRNSRGQH